MGIIALRGKALALRVLRFQQRPKLAREWERPTGLVLRGTGFETDLSDLEIDLTPFEGDDLGLGARSSRSSCSARSSSDANGTFNLLAGHS
jgi:hypothetical protein